jgi:hypothetical protein
MSYINKKDLIFFKALVRELSVEENLALA